MSTTNNEIPMGNPNDSSDKFIIIKTQDQLDLISKSNLEVTLVFIKRIGFWVIWESANEEIFPQLTELLTTQP